MKVLLGIFSVLMACKTTSHTSLKGEAPALPRYSVHRADVAPEIDGVLSDASWAKAELMSFVFPWAGQEVTESTVARLLWDDTNLYVAYDNVDFYVQGGVKEHDGTVFKDDCVEIFVSPDSDDVSRYIAFEMNVLAAMLDYTASEAGKGPTRAFDYPWSSSGVELRIALKDGTTLNDNTDRDKGWILEMRIPLANFASLRKDPAQPPALWRANLNRCKGPEKGEWGTWSPTLTEKPNFHISERFGFLNFVE